MQLKLDTAGHAVLQNGLPVYIANGKEVAIDAAAIIADRDKHQIATLFHQSEYVRDNMDLPASMIADYFGKHFSVDGDKVIAADADGVVYSRERFGEPAGFDEALDIILANHTLRNVVLKPVGERGAPKAKAPGQSSADSKTMPRKSFEAMDPKKRMAFMKSGGRLVD